MNKKRTWVIIAVIVGVIILIPALIAAGTIGVLTLYNLSKPDNSDDVLIPPGYVQTDGRQGYGAGEWEKFSYYVYKNKPVLDECFQPVSDEYRDEIQRIFDNYRYDNDDGKALLNSHTLAECVSEGDFFYIDHYNGEEKLGALIYYYDAEEQALYKLDYCW